MFIVPINREVILSLMNHIFDQIQNVKETLSITSANLVMKYAEKENKYVIGGVDLAVAVQKA